MSTVESGTAAFLPNLAARSLPEERFALYPPKARAGWTAASASRGKARFPNRAPPTARRCLTVENETSFHELAKLHSGVLLIQTSYPGSGALALPRRLSPVQEFWHFGDSDEAGFDIPRVLIEKSGREFRSFHMQRGRIPFEQDSLGRPTLKTRPFYQSVFCSSDVSV
jgi:hypothetical protein